MEIPNLLTIAIVEGPKKGETFVCRPGSVFRIGRFVRGNSIAIKDPGISQKHLTVEFQPETLRWAVTDLDTSNGTILNGTRVPPNAAFPLTGGDIIKIGEKTLFSLKISAPSSASIQQDSEEVKVPELAKRRGKCDASKGRISLETANVDKSVKSILEESNRRRPTRAASKSFSSRVSNVQEEVSVKENTEKLTNKNYREGRSLRSKRNGVSPRVSIKDNVLEPVVVGTRARRVTRASTRAISGSTSVTKVREEEHEDIKEEEVGNPAHNGGKQNTKGRRGGRSIRILRKGEALESVVYGDKVEGSLNRAYNAGVASSARVPMELRKRKKQAILNSNSVSLVGKERKKSIVKNTGGGDRKLAANRKVRIAAGEEGNATHHNLSRKSIETEDMDFPSKIEFSWNSFSEIRGIPNTTSKYREDRMINCHTTPFEARVERALNRRTGENLSNSET